MPEDETEILPHRPDGFFTLRFPPPAEDEQELYLFDEADRRRTDCTKFRRRLRSHFQYFAQKKHWGQYGVDRIRAVLVETITRDHAVTLLNASVHPLVTG